MEVSLLVKGNSDKKIIKIERQSESKPIANLNGAIIKNQYIKKTELKI